MLHLKTSTRSLILTGFGKTRHLPCGCSDGLVCTTPTRNLTALSTTSTTLISSSISSTTTTPDKTACSSCWTRCCKAELLKPDRQIIPRIQFDHIYFVHTFIHLQLFVMIIPCYRILLFGRHQIKLFLLAKIYRIFLQNQCFTCFIFFFLQKDK